MVREINNSAVKCPTVTDGYPVGIWKCVAAQERRGYEGGVRKEGLG